MKLIRVDGINNITLAEIQGNEVVYLHPTIQRVIDLKKCIVLPPIKPIIDKFGSQEVKQGHAKWAKAVQIYLELDWISKAPKAHKWINDDESIK